MSDEIRDDTVRQILAVVPRNQSTERVQVVKATGYGGDGTKPVRRPVVNKTASVGRNDPCPCGSGKKYKACCWLKNQNSGKEN
jgi:preprotein translocase subunit SecA